MASHWLLVTLIDSGWPMLLSL